VLPDHPARQLPGSMSLTTNGTRTRTEETPAALRGRHLRGGGLPKLCAPVARRLKSGGTTNGNSVILTEMRWGRGRTAPPPWTKKNFAWSAWQVRGSFRVAPIVGFLPIERGHGALCDSIIDKNAANATLKYTRGGPMSRSPLDACPARPQYSPLAAAVALSEGTPSRCSGTDPDDAGEGLGKSGDLRSGRVARRRHNALSQVAR